MKHRRNHSLRYIVTEFFDLFPDVFHKSVARPPSDKHDHEDRTTSNEHCHGTTRSYRVGSDFGRFDVQNIFSNDANCVMQCTCNLLRRDVAASASYENSGNWRVVVGVFVATNSTYDGGSCTDWAHGDVFS